MDANVDAFVPGGGTITLSEGCPAFTPCGGSIVGTWQYESICIEHSEVLGAFPAICRTGTVIEEGGGTVDGTITATDSSITRTISTSTSATILINATCSALGCDSIQTMVRDMAPGSTATCAAAGTTPERCRCMITFVTTIDETQSYSITGDTMTTGDGRTFDICVDAGTLQSRETGARGARRRHLDAASLILEVRAGSSRSAVEVPALSAAPGMRRAAWCSS